MLHRHPTSFEGNTRVSESFATDGDTYIILSTAFNYFHYHILRPIPFQIDSNRKRIWLLSSYNLKQLRLLSTRRQSSRIAPKGTPPGNLRPPPTISSSSKAPFGALARTCQYIYPFAIRYLYSSILIICTAGTSFLRRSICDPPYPKIKTIKVQEEVHDVNFLRKPIEEIATRINELSIPVSLKKKWSSLLPYNLRRGVAILIYQAPQLEFWIQGEDLIGLILMYQTASLVYLDPLIYAAQQHGSIQERTHGYAQLRTLNLNLRQSTFGPLSPCSCCHLLRS